MQMTIIPHDEIASPNFHKNSDRCHVKVLKARFEKAKDNAYGNLGYPKDWQEVERKCRKKAEEYV